MNALLANRAVRRKGIAYLPLGGASLVPLPGSSTPFVRDLQHGVAFAFRPVQIAVDGIARDVSSIATTIAQIDRLRQENAALQAENDQLEAESRTAAELRRENEL